MYLSSQNSLRLGLILILVSAIVMGVSIYGVYTSMNTYRDITMNQGSSSDFYINVSQGQSVSYTILVNNNITSTFTSTLISPTGGYYQEENFTGGGISESYAVPQGGQWHLAVHMNSGNSTNVSVHIGSLPFIDEAGVYSGITLLAIGIVFILFHYNMERREGEMRKQRYQ